MTEDAYQEIGLTFSRRKTRVHSMSLQNDEPIVYQCKLHRGIFVLPVFLTLPFIAPGILYYLFTYIFLGQFFNAVGPLGAQPQVMFSIGSMMHMMITVELLIALLTGGIFFLFVLVAYLRSEVVLTENKLRFSTGLISFRTSEILLIKIETLSLVNPLLGRVLGYGTVAVRGTGGSVFNLQYLHQPDQLYTLLQQMTNEAPSSPTPSVKQLSQQLEDMHQRYMPKE